MSGHVNLNVETWAVDGAYRNILPEIPLKQSCSHRDVRPGSRADVGEAFLGRQSPLFLN